MIKLEFGKKFVGGGNPQQPLKINEIGGCDTS